MKLTKKLLEQLIKEEMAESTRYRGSGGAMSSERRKEINVRRTSKRNPKKAPKVDIDRRKWKAHVQPALEKIEKDMKESPSEEKTEDQIQIDNLADELLYSPLRYILPWEYEQIIKYLQKPGDEPTDFETNAKALVNWQAEYR